MIDMTLVLGIDIGTQSVKTGLLDVDSGELRHMAVRPYSGGALQPPGELWNAALEAMAETMHKNEAGSGAIAAAGICGQMHGTVLIGAGGEAMGDVINWQDERCNRHAPEFQGLCAIERMEQLIPADIAEDLGVDRMASGFQAATLFHIMHTNPDLFRTVHHALTPTDYIRRQLLGGGDFVTDPTNAFGTGVFDVRRNCWSEEAMNALGLPPALFPEVRPTDSTAGEVCAFVARRTGLMQGTPVCVGGGDNQMAMIGCGASQPGGPACISIGTSSQICALTPSYARTEGIDTRSFPGGCYALVYAGLAGGKCYTWLRNMLLADLAAVRATTMQASELFKHLDSLAAIAPSGCDGLRFEPTLRGTRRNPALRGAFTGISEKNFFIGFRARAVMEGVARELRKAFDAMDIATVSGLAGAGNGLVRSQLWREITARCFGAPVRVTDFENAVFGAAAVAAQAVGLRKFKDIPVQFAFEANP
jgi:xylulokinase